MVACAAAAVSHSGRRRPKMSQVIIRFGVAIFWLGFRFELIHCDQFKISFGNVKLLKERSFISNVCCVFSTRLFGFWREMRH